MSPLSGPIGLPMDRTSAPAPPPIAPLVRLGLWALPAAVLVALIALAWSPQDDVLPWADHAPGEAAQAVASGLVAAGLAGGFFALARRLPPDAPAWTRLAGPALAITGGLVLAVASLAGTEATGAVAHAWTVWTACGRVAFALGATLTGVALLFGEHPAPVGIGLAVGGVLWMAGGLVEPTVLGMTAFLVSAAWVAWSASRSRPTPAA